MDRSCNSKMQSKYRHHLQIVVQSPEFPIQSRTLIVTPTPSYTLAHLKRSLFPDLPSSSFYFTLNGKPLGDSAPLHDPPIAPLSTLVLRTRLHGGGGDGGATGAESRDCYLNMYAEKKPDKVDPNEQRLSKWLNCALSNDPLREPCVIDKLGNLFNKQALVEALLQKNLPKEFGHIKGLKDMLSIRLSQIPGSDSNMGGTRFQCPITGLEFNGKYKFFALKNCGHVLSAKAMKEVKSSSCLVCHEEFAETDKIVINGSEEEVAILRERMEERAKARDKKSKKSKLAEAVANGQVGGALESARLSGTKHVIDANAAEKALGKVEVNGEIANGRVALSSRTAKRFKAVDIAPPNATKEVYASIFTSSKKSDSKETFTCY